MSTPASPPNPCLLAILVIVQGRTGSGAQIVFHYPPDPLSDDQSELRPDSDFAGDEVSSSSDSDETSSSSDDEFGNVNRRSRRNGLFNKVEESTQEEDEEDGYKTSNGRNSSDRTWKPAWEPLLGFGEDGLVSLLAPGRAWHKRKFEMAINDLTFLGRPIYAREDGSWQKRKNGRYRDDLLEGPDLPSDTAGESDQGSRNRARDLRAPRKPRKNILETRSELTMFNVVFVMDSPPLEQALHVKEMYENVTKKLSKVLKWAQVHENYVCRESEVMQTIRATHLTKRSSSATLYAELMKQSSLATAIATIYKSISASRIAAVSLTPTISVSLQIPPVPSTAYLPSLNDPPIQPGLWLTTANDNQIKPSEIDSATETDALLVAKSLTLLLRASPNKILKDIQLTGGPLALPLTNFIEQGRPTKSFYKTSVTSKISLTDIQQLARHLIYWRRAVAIPPLHQRDTYIVSPNADMTKLVEASKNFEALFPMMPSLPKFLSLMSGTPIPFGSLIPSSDHKEEYYRVLATLMRGGWVTQLRTFAYVRIDPKIKKAVRDIDIEQRKLKHKAEGEERAQLKKETATTNDSSDMATKRSEFNEGSFQQTAFVSPPFSSSFKTSYNPLGSSLTATETFSSMPRTKRPSIISYPSDSQQPFSSSTTTSANNKSARSSASDLKQSSLILSPLRASAEESKWLTYISTHLGTEPTTNDRVDEQQQDDGPPSPSTLSSSSATTNTSATSTTSTSTTKQNNHPNPNITPSPPSHSNHQHNHHYHQSHQSNDPLAELRHYWPKLIKYFNGNDALEKIPVREGLKRKFVWDELLNKIWEIDPDMLVANSPGSGSSGEKKDLGRLDDDEGGGVGGGGEQKQQKSKGQGQGQIEKELARVAKGNDQGRGQGRIRETEKEKERASQDNKNILVTFRHW